MSGRIRIITSSWNFVQKSEVLAAAVEDRLGSEVARKFGRFLLHIGIPCFVSELHGLDDWFAQICQGDPLFVHFVTVNDNQLENVASLHRLKEGRQTRPEKLMKSRRDGAAAHSCLGPGVGPKAPIVWLVGHVHYDAHQLVTSWFPWWISDRFMIP